MNNLYTNDPMNHYDVAFVAQVQSWYWDGIDHLEPGTDEHLAHLHEFVYEVYHYRHRVQGEYDDAVERLKAYDED